MEWFALIWLALAAGSQSWEDGQVNSTTCQWSGLRAIVLKDTLYVDGGKIFQRAGFANGQIKERGWVAPDNAFYKFNFNTAFNIDQNTNSSVLFGRVPKFGQSVTPSVSNGALLGNDFGFYLYGGLPVSSDTYVQPTEREIFQFYAEQYGVQKPGFQSGIRRSSLPNEISGYLADGGVANVPSENKAYLFAGMQSPTKGPVYEYTSVTPKLAASELSNALVKLDLGTQYSEKWNNITLGPGIKPRADPSVVWVPVGPEGILVVIGGVTKPEWNTLARNSSDASAKESDKSFLTTIDIYDIPNNKWYQQNTSGDAPTGPLTRGCAVLAYPDDQSSYNIYYYGGYDGYSSTNQFSDDVWVLSLPSFTWTRLYPGVGVHARAGHVCVQSDPATMFVVGGYVDLRVSRCLMDVVTVFNLTSGLWLTSYDPAKYAKYGVHQSITAKIGGNAAGGATKQSPDGAWADQQLGTLFASKYDMNKIKAYYPYKPAPVTNNTNPSVDPPSSGSSGGLPSFVAPLLGVVLGLMLLTAIGVGIVIYRRRKLLRSKEGSVAGTDDQNGHRILSWIRGQPSEGKTAMTVTTAAMDEPPRIISPEPPAPVVVSTPSPEPNYGPYYGRQELGDTQLAEMLGDTTHNYAELGDTGLSPIDIVDHYSNVGRRVNSTHNHNASPQSTMYSHSHADHASSISRATDPTAAGPGMSNYDGRADSPPLGTLGTPYFQPMTAAAVAHHPIPSPSPPIAQAVTPPPVQAAAVDEADARIVSGVSNMSERDRAHLRQTSDTSVATVSSMNTARRGLSPEPLGPAMAAAHSSAAAPAAAAAATTAAPPAAAPETTLSQETGMHPMGRTPPAVSPPTPGQLGGDGDDYLTARRAPMSPGAVSAISPLRRSAFHENEEDLHDPARGS